MWGLWNFSSVFTVVLPLALLLSPPGLLGKELKCFGLLSKSMKNSTWGASVCPQDSLALVDGAIFCNPSRIVESLDTFLSWYFNTTRYLAAPRSDLHYGRLSICDEKMGDISVDDSAQIISFSSDFVLASAFREFTAKFQWRRLAFVTDFASASSLRFKDKVENTFKNSGVHIHYYRTSLRPANTLRKINKQKYKIIAVSLPQDALDEIMTERLKLGMEWPDYVWIILGEDYKTPQNKFSLYGVFVFQPEIREAASKVNIKVSISNNKLYIPYMSNDASSLNFTKVCPPIRQKSYTVYIYQVGKTNTKISKFSLAQNLTPFTLSYAPADTSLETSLLWYIIFSLVYFPVFILLTITTVLYFKFRNRPEIKATSVSLNVFIFVGCYLLLAYNIVLNLNVLPNYYKVRQEVRDFMCLLQLWFNGLSIPTALILSVMLVKLVRVYRIFNQYTVMNKWSCHNAVLALYVLLLIFPLSIICLVQSIIHRYRSSVTTGSHNGNFIAYLECKNDVDFYWLFVQLVYLLFLTVLIVVMAIKTRKVYRNEFKDTKKVIALMMAVIMTSTLGLVYVFVFDSIIQISYLASTALLMLTHCSFVMECIGFLYMPKFYSILKK